MNRWANRKYNELREISLDLGYIKNADGSCLVKFGNTHVICTATVDEQVPRFLRSTGQGWVTAEYGMLPRSTENRMQREAAKGKQSGRTQEIQRLIGRTLRSAVDLERLGERQVIVDCDVIQADGGTRTAAITGGYVALCQAINDIRRKGKMRSSPIVSQVAAISCGIIRSQSLLDLDYKEDSSADVDANFVMNSEGRIIEIQCTAEESAFSREELNNMMELAEKGINILIQKQKEVLKL